MRVLLPFGMLLILTAGTGYSSRPAGQQLGDRKVKPEVLAAALYCAEPDATAESVRRFSGDIGYRVRYLYGVDDPATDRANELHIVSYSKSEDRAWLYEMLVDKGAEGEYTLTWLNSAKLRRQGKVWTVLDTLGGIYSYQRVRKLADQIAKTEEIRVPYRQGKPPGVSCKRRVAHPRAVSRPDSSGGGSQARGAPCLASAKRGALRCRFSQRLQGT